MPEPITRASDLRRGPWSYLGPDGTSGTYFSTAAGESVGPSVISRYCRVKAYLEGDGSVTPVLERLELSYSGTLDSAYQTFVAFRQACNRPTHRL